MTKFGFNRVKESPWRFYNGKYNIVIDLLPFGEIEEEFTVNFNERYTDLHILGFSEVLHDSERVGIEQKHVQIPSLEE